MFGHTPTNKRTEKRKNERTNENQPANKRATQREPMALEEHQIQQQRQAQTGNTQDYGETRATGNNRGQRDSTNNTAYHKEQWGTTR